MDLVAAASLSQVAATFVASISAAFVGLQIRAASRSSDFSSLVQFHKDFADHERRLLSADENDFHSFFVEYLNLIELYAAIQKSSLVGKATKTQIVERLRDALAVIEMNENRAADFKKARSTPMALSEIERFSRINRAAIDRSKRQLYSQRDGRNE